MNKLHIKLGCLAIAAVSIAVSGCGTQVDRGPLANGAIAKEIRLAFSASSEGAGSTEGAETIGTGWATIRGRFVYDGTPPTMPPYKVDKDQATCMHNNVAPPQETLLVDSTGGLKNVAVFLRDASRVHESAQPQPGTVVFDQKECVFLSHVCGMTVGQTLDIRNSDNVGHNTNIAGKKNSFNQTIPAGASVAYTVQKEEATPAPINCSIHPWMIAYLLPRENAYFAITAADGTFEITNVPAGEKIEFQVWHENAARAGGAIVVNTPEAKAINWSNKGRFSVTLEPDEVKEIEIKIPPSAFKG
jgi:plastocyanin